MDREPSDPDPLDPELLALLACPETKQAVLPADAKTLERLNQAVANGTLRNRAGGTVDEPITAALVREDRQVAYPVRDGIPILIAEEGIPLSGADD